ncbi:MAG: hypothetical protein KDB03_17305 [Planctomycetales bacterium]|nr:hypothetical protein [Planctomycetales bacterium]
MSLPPIANHGTIELSRKEQELALQAASSLSQRYPEIVLPSYLVPFQVQQIDARPTLHCDDLTAITRPTTCKSITFFQERARLRAMDGDWVVTSFAHDVDYDNYLCDALHLGAVQWLHPTCPIAEKIEDRGLLLAEACWEDRRARRMLVNAIRHQELAYIHPHIGTQAIWELALLLSEAAHRKIFVIAPPAGLAAMANDKGKFAQLVGELFGSAALPQTSVAWNTAHAAHQLRGMLGHSTAIAIKLPSSAGGVGNLVWPINKLSGLSLTDLQGVISRNLIRIGYCEGDELVVSRWEQPVLSSPSAQFWIPASTAGDPVFEGFFAQLVDATEGRFIGSSPTVLPEPQGTQALHRCGVIARAFQILGYVGRCSFDMLLVGERIEDSQLLFVECNARWGGTSLPMTLVNRLFGSYQTQPFTIATLALLPNSHAKVTPYANLLKTFDTLLYRPTCTERTSAMPVSNKYVYLDPQRTRAAYELTYLSLGQKSSESSSTQKEIQHILSS